MNYFEQGILPLPTEPRKDSTLPSHANLAQQAYSELSGAFEEGGHSLEFEALCRTHAEILLDHWKAIMAVSNKFDLQSTPLPTLAEASAEPIVFTHEGVVYTLRCSAQQYGHENKSRWGITGVSDAEWSHLSFERTDWSTQENDFTQEFQIYSKQRPQASGEVTDGYLINLEKSGTINRIAHIRSAVDETGKQYKYRANIIGCANGPAPLLWGHYADRLYQVSRAR
ncbi:MAG: hypothetical protein NUV98_06310 [Candidatus Roizmanbacteria bacterium]|nr:hypothetical protein [Candidatus Roizmanbacteria bacterium]